MYHHHGSYGHTRRILHFIAALKNLPLEIVIIAGGELTPFMHPLFPTSVKLVELPPLISDCHFKHLRPVNTALTLDETKGQRLDLIKKLILTEAPDILCCEFFPFGRHQIAEEFTTAIQLVREQQKKTFVISTMRDLLGVHLSKEKKELIGRYSQLFDEILVHGDKDFLSFDQELIPLIQDKIFYTGYLTHAPPLQRKIHSPKRILVSMGGGRDGEKIIEIIFQLAQALPQHHFKLITGEFSPANDLPKSANVEVLKLGPDLLQELKRAHFFISMCGYNTFCEAYLSQIPTLFIPRDFEPEQLLRAREASLKVEWMSYIPISKLTVEAIFTKIQNDLFEITEIYPINMSGLENVQQYFRRLLSC